MNKIIRIFVPFIITFLFLGMLNYLVGVSSLASASENQYLKLLAEKGFAKQPDHTQNSLVVDTFQDELIDDGNCSLREAIQTANTNMAVDDCLVGDAVITDTISFDPNVSGTITVTVPADAPWYDTNNAIILATGVTSSALTAEAQITTTAFDPAHINVDPDSFQSTQFVGEVTTQTMTISNGPGVTLTYEILEGVTPDTVLMLNLDEPAGSSIFDDSSIMNNDGVCTGDSCPTSGIPGHFEQAVLFDGIDDYIQSSTYGLPTGSADRTMAAWVKINSFVAAETFFIGYGNFGSYYEMYNLMTTYQSLCFKTWGSDFCGPELEIGTWYHIAVTNTGDFVTLYLNGNPVASNNSYFNTPGDTQLTLGRIPGYLGDERKFNGLIDEVIVLDRALNAEEIMALYQGGLSGDVPWLVLDPISGEVPTNSSAIVKVTFDATSIQPGMHESDFIIYSNDPLQPRISIPVTLTVEPTANMGQVQGIVSDAWTGDPLTATVDLVGVYVMTADPEYNIWAVSGNYSLSAYTAGYSTMTLPVEITAGEVTIQDLALEPALPRLSGLPDQIRMSLTVGSKGTQILELVNNGPMPLDFSFHEVNLPMNLVSEGNLVGKHILYDRAHCQSELSEYSYLTSDLINAGAIIDENFDPFDDTTLDGYDILWVSEGNCSWTSDELYILENWLAGRGTILIQGMDTEATYDTAGIFGITYEHGYCNLNVTFTHIYPHPITEGVNGYYVNTKCGYLMGGPPWVILDNENKAHMIALEQGTGKMVVLASIGFHDSAINFHDNRLLAMNTFRWLATPVYGDIPWLYETPEQGSVNGHSNLATTLTFDTTGINPGIYEGLLMVEHNDPNQVSPVIIPIQLNIISIPPSAITITGPETGLVGVSQILNASIEPISTTLPLTYTWQTVGQLPVTHTSGELMDTVGWAWEMPGIYTISVTASNIAGEVSDSHVINITEPIYNIYLPLIIKPVGAPAGSIQIPSQQEEIALIGLVVVGIIERWKKRS